MSIEVKKYRKRHSAKWFINRVGKNVYRRIRDSITEKLIRQFFQVESMNHAMSLYLSQNNGFRYDEV